MIFKLVSTIGCKKVNHSRFIIHWIFEQCASDNQSYATLMYMYITDEILTGATIPHTPSTNSTLKKAEPTMVPTPISLSIKNTAGNETEEKK